MIMNIFLFAFNQPFLPFQTMALTADSESDISLANMDAETIAKMKIIQEKLAHMLR